MAFSTIGNGGDRRLLAAAKHNTREIPVHAADPARSRLNVVIRGSCVAQAVRDTAVRLRQGLGIELKRKDATIAAEILFSLPPSTPIDVQAYMLDCLAWVDRTFGAEGVFSAIVHRDESAPHMHVLLLPARHGAWLASSVFGRRAEVQALQDDFHRHVASKYGIQRTPTGLTAADRRRVEEDVLQALRVRSDPVMQSPVWLLVRARIKAEPVAFAELLGIPVAKRMRTMAEIFTSPGKGSAQTPIGVEAAPNHRHLSCVGVAHSEPTIF